MTYLLLAFQPLSMEDWGVDCHTWAQICSSEASDWLNISFNLAASPEKCRISGPNITNVELNLDNFYFIPLSGRATAVIDAKAA